MAIITKTNIKKGINVLFQEQELVTYDGIYAQVVIWRKKSFVNFHIDFMTWQGHDRRVTEDLIDALKKVGNFSAKVKGASAGGWTAHAHEPTIATPAKVRIPVYENHLEPFVQIERDSENFMKWSVMGHYFNDDLPSVRAYVAALTSLLNYAVQMKWVS